MQLNEKLYSTKHLLQSKEPYVPIAYSARPVVIRGFNAYARQEAKQEVFEVRTSRHTVTVTQKKVWKVAQNPKVFFQFLNSSLRSIMSRLEYVQIGKSGKYFTKENFKDVDQIKMFKGFCSSFVDCQGGMFLRVDSARKVIQNNTAEELINDIYNHKYKGETDKDKKRQAVRQALIGQIVMTNYGKCQFYRVLDLQFLPNTKDSLVGELTMEEYYYKRYNVQIKNLKQPLLVVENKIKRREQNGTQNPCLLVPELCLMTGIPDTFDENRRRAISKETILSTENKLREIQDFMKKLDKSGQLGTLREIGINLESRLNRCQVGKMNVPVIQLGNGDRVPPGKENAFTFFNQEIFSRKHDLQCTMIYVKGFNVAEMIQTFEKTSAKFKLNIKINKLELESNKTASNYLSGVERALNKYPETNMLLVIIPVGMKQSYPTLKKKTLGMCKDDDKQYPRVTSQFVVEGTLKKGQSVHTKLLTQMIAKRGNILWAAQLRKQLQPAVRGAMLLGIDSGSKDKVESYAGCGTTNSSFSLIYSGVKKVESKTEKFKDMLIVSKKCVSGYVARNKKPPVELIVFMNTVPADQISQYQKLYCERLIEEVRQTYGETMRLTVVMVNLRVNERFFDDKNGRILNVVPGTVVNKEVVSREYDFFIISQQARMGTVVPNHFKVIYNDSKMEEGHLQELIYDQCFNYSNWSGSIKIPAILQYAKKCARFNAEVLAGDDVVEAFDSKPYYI